MAEGGFDMDPVEYNEYEDPPDIILDDEEVAETNVDEDDNFVNTQLPPLDIESVLDTDNGMRQSQRQHPDFFEQTFEILRVFMNDQFERDSIKGAPKLDEHVGSLSPEEIEQCREVGSCLREIGDTLNQDVRFQRFIDSVTPDEPMKAIIAVAKEAFDEGGINWGRIITLFYFAYKICVKVLKYLPDVPSWVNQLIKEIVTLLVTKAADWIINQGGWAIPSVSTVDVFNISYGDHIQVVLLHLIVANCCGA
ncbi:apoptosis regulator BAX-like [Patiria miniata]|uniref:Bcl-2 Bcl-2 homology region 1-3 domain-containing protein n=1 Tax=Patiria miniata TaxID=46514 RepID=A0A914A7U6_PATMI|nr:apoptosis regulator BAX-like [Patiria miniata]